MYVYQASMKIEELSRENEWSTYEIQNVLSEIISTYYGCRLH